MTSTNMGNFDRFPFTQWNQWLKASILGVINDACDD